MRVDGSRHIGYFTATFFLIFLLMVSSVLPVNFTFAQSQTVGGEQFPQSIIASSTIETTPHFLKLKATQQGDAEPERVSGFNLDTTNAVVAQINSQLLVCILSSRILILCLTVLTNYYITSYIL